MGEAEPAEQPAGPRAAGRRAVVTGASGHIGYHVAGNLLARGARVHLLVRRVTAGVADLLARGATHRIVQLSRPLTFAEDLAGADVLFHLAAENTTDRSDPGRVLDATVGLTRSVLATAVEQGVGTIVYTSSAVVLGRGSSPDRPLDESSRATTPESPYVLGKLRAEEFCDELECAGGVDLRRVYPSWVVGPGDWKQTPPHRVVARCISRGQRAYFEGGISIAAVEPVADAHVDCWLRGRRGGRYVLGGQNITFRELFTILNELAGRRGPLIKLPRGAVLAAAHLLAAVARPFGKTGPLDPAYAKTLVGSFSWYDSGRAVRELGYTIPPARESLARAARGERQRAAGTHLLGLRRPAAASDAEGPPLLVTGVPGWLGSTMVDALINGVDAASPPPRRRVHLLVHPSMADLLDLPEPFRVFPGDILDAAAVDAALEGVSTVYHLAGAIYPPRTRTLYRVNAEGTRNLVDRCIALGVRRVLYAGTDAICGRGMAEARVFNDDQPDNPYRDYGRSKQMGEAYVLEKSRQGLIDGTSLRGFWFFGPFAPARQRRFLDMLGWRRQIIFGDGRNYRSITHVADMAAAFLLAEFEPRTFGRWYWINEGRSRTLDEVHRLLCRGLGSTFRPVHVPGLACRAARLADAILGLAGRLHPTIHSMGKMDFDIAGRIVAAERDFGYKPRRHLDEQPEEFLGLDWRRDHCP